MLASEKELRKQKKAASQQIQAANHDFGHLNLSASHDCVSHSSFDFVASDVVADIAQEAETMSDPDISGMCLRPYILYYI